MLIVKLIYCMCSVRECSLNIVAFVDYYCVLVMAEQRANVGISRSMFSQQTTSMAENATLVSVMIGEHIDGDESDDGRERITLAKFNTDSVLQSVTLENNESLVLEEGYSNATYAERFGRISVSTVEMTLMKHLFYGRTIAQNGQKKQIVECLLFNKLICQFYNIIIIMLQNKKIAYIRHIPLF